MAENLERMVMVAGLFDAYGALLTRRQQEFVNLHYMMDLSYSEISDEYGVSRQAVHDTISRAVDTLVGADRALGILDGKRERERRLLEAVTVLRSLADTVSNAEGLESSFREHLAEALARAIALLESSEDK